MNQLSTVNMCKASKDINESALPEKAITEFCSEPDIEQRQEKKPNSLQQPPTHFQSIFFPDEET